MQADKLRKLIKGVLYAAVAVTVIVGCSDNGQNKAAKELHEATEKAMALAERGPRLDGDTRVNAGEVFAEARSQLNKALAKASMAGDAAGSAYLAGGNLDFAQVRFLRKELHEYSVPVSVSVDELSVMGRKITNLQIQQDRLEQIVTATQEEAVKLTGLIEGTDSQQGLKAKLAAAQAKLSQLETAKAEWLAKQEDAQEKANEIQQQADAKLQKADLSEGSEKATLQRHGFALLQSKKEPLVKAQEAEDEASILQSKINTVAPIVAKLEEDVERISAKIAKAGNSPEREKLQSEADDVKNQISSCNLKVGELVADLNKGVKTYDEQVSKIITLLDSAEGDYKKIRSRSLSQISKSQIANCNFWKASVLADDIGFKQHVAARLGYIAAADMGEISTTLSEVGLELSKVSEEAGKAIIEAYDAAIAAYQSGSDKDTMSNHALALYGKMAFAERLGDFDTADAALDEADKLLEKIKQADPVFFTSVTSRILTGSKEFIPPMSVDLAAQYEELKKEFQPWKKLRGDEKKAEVEKMLAMLDNMKPPLDPQEFDRIIGPERKALEDQMAKGFDEPVVTNTNDPNFF